MKRSAMLLAAVAMLTLTASAWAAGSAASRPEDEKFLDDLVKKASAIQQQEAAAAAVAAAAAATTQPGDPTAKAGADLPGNDQVAKDGEEEDEDALVKALLRKAGGDSGKPIMVDIIDNMGLARSLLREKYVTGEETQKVEKQVIDLLTQAIAAAAQAQSQPPPSGSPKPGDKPGKPKPGPSKPSSASGPPQFNKGKTPAQVSQASHGNVQNGDVNQPINEGRREWGGLPDRDRESVVEGQGERAIPAWDSIIRRYYTALNLNSQPKKD